MSSTDWIKDRETGRNYVLVQDKSGKSIRRWQDEGEAHSRSGRHEPSSRTRRQTPRSEPSQDPRVTLDKAASSSSSRRPSVSSPRPSFKAVSREDQARSQPINIINKSSVRYHDDGANRKQRDERRDHVSGSHNDPSRSGAKWPPESEGSATYVGSTQDNFLESTNEEDLSKRLGGMAMDEFDYDREYTTSASAPAAHGRFSSHEFRRRDRIALDQLSGGQQYQGKGKDISKDEEEIQIPPHKSSRLIAGTPGKGKVEELDDSYMMRNRDYKRFFKPGRVFCTLWTDAYAGETNTKNESQHDQFMSQVSFVRHNQRVYTKIRRFVVVRLGDRFCTCLPVTTYDGRGYRKRGINLDEHGLIYSEKVPNGVDGIHKQPLFVKISSKADKLVNTSYINYGRVYTVECNVKVKDVGELDSHSLRLLKKYYNEIHHAPEDDPDEGSSKRPPPGDDEFKGIGAGIAGDLRDYGAHSGSSGRMMSSIPGANPGNYAYNETNRQTYSTVNTQTYRPVGQQQPGIIHHNTTYEQNPNSSHGGGNIQYGSGYDPNRSMSSQGAQLDHRFSYPSQHGGFQDPMSHRASGQSYQQPVQAHYSPQNPNPYPTSTPIHGAVSSTQYHQGGNQYAPYQDNNPQPPANIGFPPRPVGSDIQYHPRDSFPPPITTTPYYQQSGNSGQYPPHGPSMDLYPPTGGQHQHQHQPRDHHQEPIIREDEELELPHPSEIIRNRRNSTIASSRSHDPRSGRDRDRDRDRGRDYDSGRSGSKW